jgi:hypothetical protein
MKRSLLPGASRGLGRTKPHIELDKGVWYAFNILPGPGAYMGRVIHNAEVVETVGRGPTAAHAFTDWFNMKWHATVDLTAGAP